MAEGGRKRTASAPATVDGAPTKSFTVTASTGQTMTADEPNMWAIVPELTDGQPVSFTVTATSTAGTSAPSPPSKAITPEPVASPPNVVRGSSAVGPVRPILGDHRRPARPHLGR